MLQFSSSTQETSQKIINQGFLNCTSTSCNVVVISPHAVSDELAVLGIRFAQICREDSALLHVKIVRCRYAAAGVTNSMFSFDKSARKLNELTGI